MGASAPYDSKTMTQEEKYLLLKDLCARLLYGIKAYEDDENPPVIICSYEAEDTFIDSDGWSHKIGTFKPYLRPMSSMTEEERKELKDILREKSFAVDCRNELIIYTNSEYDCDNYFSDFYDIQDWLNSHHFDFRNLIEKGLALEAPKGMYKED